MNLTDAIQYALNQRVDFMLNLAYNPDDEIHRMTYDEAATYAEEDGKMELASFLAAAHDLMECHDALHEELNFGT